MARNARIEITPEMVRPIRLLKNGTTNLTMMERIEVEALIDFLNEAANDVERMANLPSDAEVIRARIRITPC